MTGIPRIRLDVGGERDQPLMIVINTMKRWLDGEPVWPYAKILDEWGQDFEMYRKRLFHPKFATRYILDRTLSMHITRDAWIKKYGFFIPCAELLAELKKQKHIIEVGAGSGYMTRLMRQHGIDVVGTDYDWRGPSQYGFTIGEYDSQQINGAPGKTMVRRYRDSTVFCSWPSLGRTWFRQMLKAMRIGQRIIAIREDACAEDSAWHYLDDCFRFDDTIDIPAFTHLNDIAVVYTKKKQNGEQHEQHAED